MKAFLSSNECIQIVGYGYDEPHSKKAENSLQEAQKSLKLIERKITKQRPFIKVSRKLHLRSSLPQKHQKKYERFFNKNTQLLTKLKRFIFNLYKVNLNYHNLFLIIMKIIVIVNQIRKNKKAFTNTQITILMIIDVWKSMKKY